MDTKLLRLYQLQDGYCYNSDSLFLYAFARNFLKPYQTLLDIGSGSGILGLLCTRDFFTITTLIEKDLHNAYLASKNAQTNFLPANILQEDFLDFQPNLEKSKKFDIILSNPPFYRPNGLDSRNEKIRIARNAKFLPFEAMCKKIKQILHPKGNFIFCYDAKQTHIIFKLLQNCGFNAETCRFVYPRIDKDATLLLIQAKINTKNSLKILPPLITHASLHQKDNTKEVQEIYQVCNTYSIKIHSNAILLEDCYANL